MIRFSIIASRKIADDIEHVAVVKASSPSSLSPQFLVPHDVLHALVDWIVYGNRGHCGFVRSLINNDLHAAINYAKPHHLACIQDTITLVHTCLPSSCTKACSDRWDSGTNAERLGRCGGHVIVEDATTGRTTHYELSRGLLKKSEVAFTPRRMSEEAKR